MGTFNYHYVVHESTAVLALRILGLQILVGLSSLIINGSLLSAAILDQAGAGTSPNSLLFSSFAASSLVLQALDAVLVGTFLLRWVQAAYVFTPDEIIVRDGLWHTEQAVYRVDGLRELRVRQGLFGKLCNFGTITFYSPLLHQEIRLKNVPNPHVYEKVLALRKSKEAVA